MFSSDIYGYNKEEVDKYIANLKREHEKALMDEKLKVLDAERRILEAKNQSQEIESREKNILSILDAYKKAQSDSGKNIDALRCEQLRMVYSHIQAFLVEISNRCPGINTNISYKKITNEIEAILLSTQQKNETLGGKAVNDPMKILLNKMQEKKVQDSPKEIKIERSDSKEKSLIKPVTEMELTKDDKFDTLVDKFLNSKPTEPLITKKYNSGFDLKQAVNPTEDLSEIMKAFDFYSSETDDK